jgi:hypothetical protein
MGECLLAWISGDHNLVTVVIAVPVTHVVPSMLALVLLGMMPTPVAFSLAVQIASPVPAA